MILEGTILSVLNSTQVRVEATSDMNKEYTCNIPVDKFNNYGEDNFSIEQICVGLKVLFVVPEKGNVERRGYVINFYNDSREYIVDGSVMSDNPVKSIMFKKNAFKIMADGSFALYSIGRMFGIFFNAFQKKLSISMRSLDIGTSDFRVKSDDESTKIVVSGKIYSLSFNKTGDEFSLKDNFGNSISVNKTEIDVNVKNKSKISVNGLTVKKDKTVYSKFLGKAEFGKNSIKITHGNSKVYIGKSGVELSSCGSGLFVDKSGGVMLQSDKDVKILSNSTKIKSNSIQAKATTKIQIESPKLSLNDGSGKISPSIIRKVIKSISNTVIQLKPISPTGVCSPDVMATAKLSAVDTNFIKEPVVLNIIKEKSKE